MTRNPDIITGERSTCEHCGEEIIAVIDATSGCVDWGTAFDNDPTMLDFGCSDSPDTDDDGTGSHDPGEGHTPCGFKILLDSRAYWERIEAARQ